MAEPLIEPRKLTQGLLPNLESSTLSLQRRGLIFESHFGSQVGHMNSSLIAYLNASVHCRDFRDGE
jgi:hypothetical protein